MARSSKEVTNGLDAVRWVGALCDACLSSHVTPELGHGPI